MPRRDEASGTMLRRTGLSVLAATVLVDMIGFGIVLPLLPFYAEEFGATPLEITLIIASFSAMQLIAAPLWGRSSDRTGRRVLLIAGLFASAISYLLFALAHSLPMLFLSRIAAGAAGGNISVAQAYVADSTHGSERARGMGLIGAASGLGIMVGPAIGGFFSQWGLGASGYVAAALCGLNGLAAIILLPESRHFTHGEGRDRTPGGEAASFGGWLRALTRYPMRVLLGVYFLTIGSFAAMTSVLALYLERVFAVDATHMGLVFTAAGGVTVVVRGVLVGRIVRRFGERLTVRFGALILGCGIGGILLLPGRWWLALVIPLWAVGTGILFPSLASLISQATDARSQGSVLGGSQLAGGLGRVLGPVWAGVLFQQLTIGSPFAVGAGLSFAAFALAFAIPRAAGEGREPADAWAGRMGAPDTADAGEPAG